jgi:hypothetical protein
MTNNALIARAEVNVEVGEPFCVCRCLIESSWNYLEAVLRGAFPLKAVKARCPLWTSSFKGSLNILYKNLDSCWTPAVCIYVGLSVLFISSFHISHFIPCGEKNKQSMEKRSGDDPLSSMAWRRSSLPQGGSSMTFHAIDARICFSSLKALIVTYLHCIKINEDQTIEFSFRVYLILYSQSRTDIWKTSKRIMMRKPSFRWSPRSGNDNVYHFEVNG